MNRDFVAVFWKEWKEILPGRAVSWVSLRPLWLVGMVGILIPLQMNAQRNFGPMWLLFVTLVSFAAVLAVVPDSIAGERERHTLETLLATRLPDHAILIGKIAACLSYGWLLSIITIVFAAISFNAMNWSGHVFFYPGAATRLYLILLPPLVGGAVASSGVLISLHAATARQAQQTLALGYVVVGLTLGFGMSTLREWFARNLATWSATDLVLAMSAVLLAVDLVLVMVALNRFQRSKLVLD